MNNPIPMPEHEDFLGEALHLLKLQGAFYCQSELRAPWGIEMPPFDDSVMIHIVTSGSCSIVIEGQAPINLQQGDLILLPQGRGHGLTHGEPHPLTPLFDIPVNRISERYETMQFGGDGELCRITCCVAHFEHATGQELIKHLPAFMLINTWEQEDSDWLQSTMRFMAREAQNLKPGGETVITHLVDILIIQAIRNWLARANTESSGWLAALKDKKIGKALAAIHRSPEKNWSVDRLAEDVGMSRSAFSARFSELVGESAMRYLTRWRMQLAHMHLKNGSEPLMVLADQLGYQSEAAFSRAFKRVFGLSPGAVRQEKQTSA